MSQIAFHNGKIITGFDPLKTVEAMIISEGKVERIGLDDEILHYSDERGLLTVDLGGKTVMPGFIDAHMHMDELGEYLNIIDLRGASSIEQLKSLVKENSNKFGEWIIGHGWDQELFKEKRWPTRFDLDEAVKDKPIFLSRVDLHCAVLNSKAMSLLNIPEKFRDSDDAMKNEKGEFIGVVKEKPFEESRNIIRTLTGDEQIEKYLIDGMNEALSKGVTALGFVSCSLRVLKILDKIRKSGELKIRVRVYSNPENLDFLKDFENSDILRVNGIKLFVDGSLGSRTALMSTPYYDDESTFGEQVIEGNKLNELCLEAESKGLHIATHAIGDKGLDLVLDAYRKLKKKHRIEHAAVIREDQYAKLREISATIVTQPHFMITDFWVLERVGRERSDEVYPLKRLIENNIEVAFSTDTPVEPINPWLTVYAAVTRGAFENLEVSETTKRQRLSLTEALKAYTIKSAQAICDSGIGSLEIGKNADFIILDRDPFNSYEAELKDITVLETFLAGNRVFRKPT